MQNSPKVVNFSLLKINAVDNTKLSTFIADLNPTLNTIVRNYTTQIKIYWSKFKGSYRCAISNEAFQTLAEFFQIAGFAPTRLIIFVFRLVIGQYFESGILFTSAGQSGDGRRRWLDVWGRTKQSEKIQQEFITPHLRLHTYRL